MRIITGLYKGRRFDIPRSFKARPTTDFAKENIFNVLAGHIDLEGKQALDLFSGTGSITLELLSRGCDRVVSVEIDRDHHAFIKQCLAKIGAVNCLPLRADALRFVKSCRQKFDFIFADPPYALGELAAIPGMVFAPMPTSSSAVSTAVLTFRYSRADVASLFLYAPHSPWRPAVPWLRPGDSPLRLPLGRSPAHSTGESSLIRLSQRRAMKFGCLPCAVSLNSTDRSWSARKTCLKRMAVSSS